MTLDIYLMFRGGASLLSNGEDIRDRRFVSEKLLQDASSEDEFGEVEAGCVIRNEWVPVGGKMDYPEFCISIRCLYDGEVDARSMLESTCRRRNRPRL